MTWHIRPSGTDQALGGITCPTSMDCLVAAGPGFLVTADGGATWAAGSTGSDQLGGGYACPTTSSCLAATENGAILKSPDGFAF